MPKITSSGGKGSGGKKAAGGGRRGAPAATAAAPAQKKIGRARVSTKALTEFTTQLSTLQDAGLPLLRSLQILESQQKPGLMKNILLGVIL